MREFKNTANGLEMKMCQKIKPRENKPIHSIKASEKMTCRDLIQGMVHVLQYILEAGVMDAGTRGGVWGYIPPKHFWVSR